MKKLSRVLYLCFPSFTIVTVLFTFSVASAHPALSTSSVTAPMHFADNGNSAHPDNQVDGPCGTILLTVNNLGGGRALFNEEVSSTQGLITNLQYSLDWSNNGGPSQHIGARYQPSLSTWTNKDIANTGAGTVTATMTATDHVGLPAPFGRNCIGTVTASNDIAA